MCTVHYTGDDIRLIVSILQDDETAYPIDLGATLNAVLVLGETVMAGPVACSNADPEADWANGIVAVEFAAATTATLTPGVYRLQIRIDDSGKRTSQADNIIIRKGYVSA